MTALHTRGLVCLVSAVTISPHVDVASEIAAEAQAQAVSLGPGLDWDSKKR